MYPFLQLGPIAVSTYFLVISCASTLGAIWFLRRTASDGMSRVLAIDLTLTCLLAGFAGARLLHIFYESPEVYREHPARALELWNGGFVFLGGALGGAMGGYLFCRWRKLPFLVMADMAVIPLSFAYAAGRVACFFNGCCYGSRCELPWAITLHGEHRHPAQLYASFWEFSVLAILVVVEKRFKNPGRLLGLWLVLHSLGRILMEHFRDDPRGDMIATLSLGTWLSLALIISGIGLLWPRPPDLVPRVAKLIW